MTVDAIYLEGRLLRDRESAMTFFERALPLPEWWGRNLDALHDCLTDLDRPVKLMLRGRAELESTPFGRVLLRVLRDSAAECPRLELETD